MVTNVKATDQLQVAIIGSGPSGFYVADALITSGISAEFTLLEKLPCPFGLIRYGVAPDHQKLKRVANTLNAIAEHPSVTFLGNVEVGKDIQLEELQALYQIIVFSNGMPESSLLGIEGETLTGVYPSNSLIGWYNGHPDYQDQNFDFDQDTAVVIGHGNVAIDICRILCKSIDELRKSDIPESALEILSKRSIKHAHLIGRRGPIQAKFTTKELHELGKLENCNVSVEPKYLSLGSACQKELEDISKLIVKKNFRILQSYGNNISEIKDKNKTQISIDFMLNPKAFKGEHQLTSAIFEETYLQGSAFNQSSISSKNLLEIQCNLAFTSVGFHGAGFEGLHSDEPKKTLANKNSRLVNENGDVLQGIYAAGWIKRGPRGVIGTNRECAQDTVDHILQDISGLLKKSAEGKPALIKILKEKNIQYVTFDDWKIIDNIEVERGQALGKPREKFTSLEDMLGCL